jgi:hypothetical protein
MNMKKALITILSVFVLMGASCPGERSTDPEIAMKQDFIFRCGQLGQTVLTATSLNVAGVLTEGEALVVDNIDKIYRPLCTGDPQPVSDAVIDIGVRAAVGALCPFLAVTAGDDMVITVAMAVQCAAQKALILQLKALEKSA